jgi:hypothetical protein
MSRFQKATRKQLKLRLALCGPTGSGKSLTALKVAAYLGTRIAVIDTENRSASKYVGREGVPEFDVLELESYSPKTYVDAIHDAEREGYDVIVIDGISQAWSGKDGALEQVDKAAKRSQSGNTFMAWRDITPLHNQFVDAMVHCKAHLIVTMRVKTEWVLEENERGKKVPRKVGMAIEQRAGLDYEMDVVGDLDIDHNLMISKTRCADLDGAVIHKPGRDLAEKLLAWVGEGVPDTRPLAGSASTQSAPASSQQSSNGSRARQTGTQRSTGAAASSTPSSDRPLPTDAEGWRAAHNAVCDCLFQELGIESGAADEYGLHTPTLPMPHFSDQAKQHAGKAYNDVPAGYLRQVLWVKPKFWADADAPKAQHVSYLVARAELHKLEAEAAERALSAAPESGGSAVPLADGSPEQQQPSSTTSQT